MNGAGAGASGSLRAEGSGVDEPGAGLGGSGLESRRLPRGVPRLGGWRRSARSERGGTTHRRWWGALAWMALGLPMSAMEWSQLPPLPDAEGLAGCFAGTSGGALVVAGGANIAERKWEKDFVKRWYDAVWVLPRPEGAWVKAGILPQARGYGVAMSTPEGLLCFGGSDAAGHHATGVRVEYAPGELLTSPLPELPRPCANLCGALVGRTVYLAGGIETPGATQAMRTFWALDLDTPAAQWRELEPWPGPERMLAVAASAGGAFYLLSGASLHAGADGKPERTFLRDAYRFTPGRGWERVPDLPRPAVAAASPAPVKDGRIFVVSGDDGANVAFEPVEKHPGFPRETLVFDVARGAWSAEAAPFSRATVPVAEWLGRFVIPNGEVRPRVRTNEVWTLR